MTDIGPSEAAQALSDIEQIVQRVRRSRTYDIASQIMILSGALVFAGNIATYLWPPYSPIIWISVNVANVLGSLAIIVFQFPDAGARAFDKRKMAMAFLMFFAFGLFCSAILGHYGPREMGAFWPVYFMFFYCLAGLWFGYAFIAIGLGITVLTLIGYFFVTGAAFLLWMAAVNGGGLILGGFWMRRN
jgi:hypothetical protein